MPQAVLTFQLLWGWCKASATSAVNQFIERIAIAMFEESNEPSQCFRHLVTKQVVELEEVESGIFGFLSEQLTINDLIATRWQPVDKPGYRGMPVRAHSSIQA